MSRCRIARRIALMATVENACAQGVSTPTLATKVLHLSLQPFSLRGRAARRRVDGDSAGLATGGIGVRGSAGRAGVQPCQDPAPQRRLASLPAPRVTPLTTPTMATNGGGSEVMQ
jgi:hypothetical protein